MPEILKPDLCVIGAGAAGLSVAASARAFGTSTVLIEKGEMGGECLNTGCVPSKALIAAGKHAALADDAQGFGIRFAKPAIDFADVGAHVHRVVADIAPIDSQERFEALGATVIRAPAHFLDKRTLEADGKTIRARRFVVATGSRPFVPPVPGLEAVPYLTNETVFDLKQCPGHLAVLGGGPVGMELAQSFARLGAKVTVIEAEALLGQIDPDLTGIALRRLKEDGVTVHARSRLKGVATNAKGISLEVETEDRQTRTILASHLLVAAGRAPVVEGLGLDAAGIAHSAKGIAVNKGLRTSNRRVFAIGDVLGGRQFTHTASYQAGLIIRAALFGLPVRQDARILPFAVYTDPEIAGIGLSEEDALKRYGDKAVILRWPFAENDRARAERRTDGLIKLIADKRGNILGCGIVGPGAGETIALFAYAMANGLKLSSFIGFVPPYPTLSEIAKRVGLEFYRDRLNSPWLKRYLGLIRLLP